MTKRYDERDHLQAKIERYEAIQKRYNEWTPGCDDSFEAIELERHLALHTGYGPVVGMPCTYSIGSDSYAAVVVKVSASGHQIWVKTDHDGPEGELFTCRADGGYRSKGHGSGYITFFISETQLDPCF